jgi:NAD(P)-dependent dehydrogenase (short-subunit alcohol dehydrogenase family)
MKTILITGCSSGFGLETARHFLERGWQVVATMRTPREDLLPPSERLRVLQLDVTDARSIRRAVEAAGIDVLVNNAGFGAPAPFELTSMETVRALFETNTFGTIAVTQAVLPQLRERRSGVIVNVTSSVTYKPLPLVGVYRAAKAAVNAFTESLAAEAEPFGVRVRIVLPGSSGETNFRDTARAGLRGIEDEAYGDFMKQAIARMGVHRPGDARHGRGRGRLARGDRSVRAAAHTGRRGRAAVGRRSALTGLRAGGRGD